MLPIWLMYNRSKPASTYVRTASGSAGSDGESGVWFFALDASNIGVTAGARATFQLPYYPCTAQKGRSSQDGEIVRYRSARLGPGFELYTMAVDGTDIVRLTNNRRPDLFPDWQRRP